MTTVLPITITGLPLLSKSCDIPGKNTPCKCWPSSLAHQSCDMDVPSSPGPSKFWYGCAKFWRLCRLWYLDGPSSTKCDASTNLGPFIIHDEKQNMYEIARLAIIGTSLGSLTILMAKSTAPISSLMHHISLNLAHLDITTYKGVRTWHIHIRTLMGRGNLAHPYHNFDGPGNLVSIHTKCFCLGYIYIYIYIYLVLP